MKPLIIYHANCWDGFCAAWIAKTALNETALGDADALPAHYGSEAPSVAGRVVYIVDFSYPREVLLRMEQESSMLFVIDHHKTAKEALDGLPFCTFDDNKSGARLTWEEFRGYNTAPWLVDYTEDRDLWRHKLPNSQEINAALRSYPLDFRLWDNFANRDPSSFVAEGEAICRREKQIVNDHVRNAVIRDMDGHKVLTVNATVLFSEIAGELAKGYPFGACYFDRSDGKRQWSLRSDAYGVDVSAIAKMHGGGGHFNAAGYEE